MYFLFDLLNKMKPANNGTANFPAVGRIHLIEILLNLKTLQLQSHGTLKNYPLTTSFRYAKVLFNTGFTV